MIILEGFEFQVVVLGRAYRKSPAIFDQVADRLQDRLLHFGYASSKEAYAHWLWRSDILFVTNHQDFFGASIVEAMYCECYPILPNRLAYPEHIAVGSHSTHLYTGIEEGKAKLREALKNIVQIRKLTSHRDFVARYDWSTLVATYDQQLAMLEGAPSKFQP